MFDPQMELLLTVLSSAAGTQGSDPTSPVTWADARSALQACGELEEVEQDVGRAIMAEDADEVRSILEHWFSGKRYLLAHDRGVLKRALKAFRKRLKITLLDAESSLGGGPMSGGRKSSIVAITPPERYPRSVWDELVRQGRLLDARMGTYELPPE